MVRSRYFMSFIKIPGDGIFNTPALFSNTPGLFSNTLGVLSLCFPIGDIPFLTGETDANFGDGTAVESVLIGVTLVVDLFKGSISGIVVLQFHDIDALGQVGEVDRAVCVDYGFSGEDAVHAVNMGCGASDGFYGLDAGSRIGEIHFADCARGE